MLRTLLIVCLFALGLTGCGQKKEPEVFSVRTPSARQEEATEEVPETEEYRLMELNMPEETVTLCSLKTGQEYRYSYHLGTKFLDKYGNRCSAVRFSPGQIVRLGELTETSALSSIQLSDKVWSYQDITNYHMEPEKNMLTIGDTKYRLTKGTVVFSGGVVSSPEAVGADDTLWVIGREKEILSVMVTTGHGYLQFVNTTLFQDSMVCIGSRIYTILTGDMTIEVPEGSYEITVANQGYGGTGSYTVTRDGTTVVDLDQLKGPGPKMCQITFETEVAGAEVTIDGAAVAVGQALDVPYGSHMLKVTAPGYASWQKVLVVNSPSATIALDLTSEEESSAAGEENSGESNSGSSSESGTGDRRQETTNNNSSQKDTEKEDGDGDKDKSSSDAEVDYLTTLSEMLTNLLD